jgi:hypothetical protein
VESQIVLPAKMAELQQEGAELTRIFVASITTAKERR